MNKSSIAILSFALLFIVSCSRNDASYTVEDRIISTYPFSDPNPIPILTKDVKGIHSNHENSAEKGIASILNIKNKTVFKQLSIHIMRHVT